jgi:hypothetical protein
MKRTTIATDAGRIRADERDLAGAAVAHEYVLEPVEIVCREIPGFTLEGNQLAIRTEGRMIAGTTGARGSVKTRMRKSDRFGGERKPRFEDFQKWSVKASATSVA